MEQKDTHVTPKKIRLPFLLEITGYGFLTGATQDMTEHEMTLQCPRLAYPKSKKPKLSSTGILTLTIAYHKASASRETLKIPCRIAYVSTIIIGIQINLQPLSPKQQRRFAELLASKN